MTYTFWSSNTGGSTPPLPPGASNSLRFRGAQQLRGSTYEGTTTVGTFSFWLKIAAPDSKQMFIMGMQSGAANGAGDLMRRAQSTYQNRFDMVSCSLSLQ